jgi:preprotein translocase subunit SecG
LEKLILTLHIIVCVVLVILVLLQSGKEGMGVIFGGGSSSLFGSTGAGGILVKLTAFVAVVFLATSLTYNIMTSSRTASESTIINVPLDDPSAPAVPVKPSANATSPAHSESEAAPSANATAR